MNKEQMNSESTAEQTVATTAELVNAANSDTAEQTLEDELFNSLRNPSRAHSIVGGKCLEFACGKGKSSVDLYTGRHIFEIPLFRNQDTLPVSLIYNSDFKDYVQAGNRVGFGMGLSIQGARYHNHNDTSSFMDGAGREEYFDYTKQREAKGTTEFGEVSNHKFYVYTKANSSMNGYTTRSGKVLSIDCIKLPSGESIELEKECISAYHKLCDADDITTDLKYNYSGDESSEVVQKMVLNSITKDGETILSFNYDSNKLVTSITKGTEEIKFSYYNGCLIEVERVSSGASDILANFVYDNARNLTRVMSCGKILDISTYNGKVMYVEERTSYQKVSSTVTKRETIGNRWYINYVNRCRTQVIDRNDLFTDYFFGEGGKLIAESVAQNSSSEPYTVARGNMNFSQVECFQGNVIISATSTAVMRERFHSCQASLENPTTPSMSVSSASGSGTTLLHTQNVSGSDMYIFACWVKANSVPGNFERYADGEDNGVGDKVMFGIRAKWYSPSEHKGKSLYVPLNAEQGGWQFIAVPFRCLNDSSATVSWYMDLSNSASSVEIKNAAVYKTKGVWKMSLDKDYSITYGNTKNEVTLFALNGFIVKKILRDNVTDTVLKTFTANYSQPQDIRILSETDYDGITTTYSYDSRNRINKIKRSKSGWYTSCDYTFHGNSGRITSETVAGGKINYTYNTYGDRLTVKLPKGDGTTCTYDNVGQLKTVKATKFATNIHSIDYKCGFPVKYTCGTQTYDMTYDGFGRILEVKENGTVMKTVAYNDFGSNLDGVSGATNSVTVTFANGFKTASYTDKYGQLIRMNENGSSVCEMSYFSSGRLQQAIDKKSNSVYTYTYQDGISLTVKETRNNSFLLKTVNYTNNNGEIDRVSYEYGLKTDNYSQSLDDAERLETEVTPLGTMDYSYDTFGRLDKRSGYGDYTKYTYLSSSTIGATDLPSQITYSDMSRFNYAYDANGNITNINTGDGSDDITYAYDNVGRITSETRKNKYYNTFAYDINGNIAERNEYPYENGAIATGKRVRKIYSYTNGRMTSFNGKSCVYDANGNPTTYLGTACEWERGRLLKKFGNTSFAYDANGLRVKKGNKEYIWSGDRLLGEVVNGDTIRYYYDASGIAGYEYRGAKFAFRKNLQGDVIGIIDSTGTLLGTYEYDAWGNCTKVDVLVMGTTAVLSMNPFRYRGYYYDSETGLYYLQSRYYDPQTGRFISPDAYSYLQPDTVNGLNLYSYCNNNPVMNVDPSGHSMLLFWLFVGATVFVATGVGIGSSIISQGIQYGWDEINWGQAIVDGIFAGISAGLAATGIGLFTSIFLGGALGALQYVADSAIRGEQMSWDGAGLAFAMGMVSGWISGAGATNITSIAQTIYGATNASTKGLAKELIKSFGSKLLAKAVFKGFVKSARKILISTFTSTVGRSVVQKLIDNLSQCV